MTMAQLDPIFYSKSFFQGQPLLASALEVFDHLPHVILYVKDTNDRFVRVNQAYVEMHGMENAAQVIGKSTYDLNPPSLARAYVEEDRFVIDSRKSLPSRKWMVMKHTSIPQWYISSKVPLFDPAGSVVGLLGAMYRIDIDEELEDVLGDIFPAARYIEEHYAEQVSMAKLAQLVGISSTHFNRRFKQVLHMTPNQYLRSVRVQVAQRLLTTTMQPISRIAYDVGYTDQSHLTKRFKEATGMTPAAYRKRFVKR